jgi:hypothetical protein
VNPSTTGSFRNVQKALHGSTGAHSYKPLNLAIIGGVIAGTLALVLLAVLAVVLFRRRGGDQQEQGRSRAKIFMLQPPTPNLPLQAFPAWGGISPRNPEVHNPFSDPSDLEKGVGHPVPTGPQERNHLADDARERWPSTPESEMHEVR